MKAKTYKLARPSSKNIYRKPDSLNNPYLKYIHRTERQQSHPDHFSSLTFKRIKNDPQQLHNVFYIRPDLLVTSDNRLLIPSGKTHAFRKSKVERYLNFAQKKGLLKWQKADKPLTYLIDINKSAISKDKRPTVLLSSPGCRMYHHWVFDVLPRLYYHRGKDKVNFLVNKPFTSFKKAALNLLEINNISPVKREKIMWFEELHINRATAESGWLDRKAIRWVRNQLLQKTQHLSSPIANENIIITRRDSVGHPRQLIEEEYIIQHFKKKGFTEVACSEYSFEQQIRIMNTAQNIVIIHGSAGANIIFAPAGAKVLHLQPDEVNAFNQHCLANRLFQHQAAIVFGVSEHDVNTSNFNHNVPWSIEPDKVKEAAKALGW